MKKKLIPKCLAGNKVPKAQSLSQRGQRWLRDKGYGEVATAWHDFDRDMSHMFADLEYLGIPTNMPEGMSNAVLLNLPVGTLGNAIKINSTPRGRAIGRLYNKGAQTANDLIKSGQPNRFKSIKQINSELFSKMMELNNPLLKELSSKKGRLIHLPNGKNKYLVKDSKGRRYLLDVPETGPSKWEIALQKKWAEINRNGIENPTAQGQGDTRYLKYDGQSTEFGEDIRPLSDWVTYK